jgi:predicted RecB family nuclease
MFLDLSGNDPSRAFAETLIQVLNDDGPIIVYNQGFEKRIIRELAQRFVDLEIPLTKLLSRVVDLLPLAGSHYYHPSMQGSWSIKAVLPAMAPELDYANLEEVAGGTAAQDAYSEAINSATTPERKAKLEAALRKYCTRDTEAMIVVLRYLMLGPTVNTATAGV